MKKNILTFTLLCLVVALVQGYDEVKLLSPQNGAEIPMASGEYTNVTLKWEPFKGANNYLVSYRTDGSRETWKEVTQTEFVTQWRSYNMDKYWWVKAMVGRDGVQSPTYSFRFKNAD